MKGWDNLTGFAKWAIRLCILAVVVGIGFVSYNKATKKSNKSTSSTHSDVSNIKVSKDADLVIAYNTFTGVEGIVLMNNGTEPNTECELYKKYGLKLQIKQMDVVADTREGLKAGKLDAVYCTVDALPVEMGSGSSLLDINTKVILKVNESKGADAIVATKGINKVADLKGKKVAYAAGTASHTLLLNTLESSGLTMGDIQAFTVSDGLESAAAFKAGTVDAALVWAPDDEDCLIAIKGSKVLVSTATATKIIADGLLTTKENLEDKRGLLVKLCRAWLEGNARLNNSQTDKATANALFAKGFNFPEDIAALSVNKVRFSTLGDNKEFFGFDATFTGVTGEKMYSRMSVKYSEAGLAKSPAPWRNVSDGSIIEELLKDQGFTSVKEQSSDVKATFTAPTEELKTVLANSEKSITLTFASGSYQLDDQAKTTVDREVTSLAQGFANARIRVEGNTDNVGSASMNRTLSNQRANAVVNYLVREYGFDKNKFVIVGNGPDSPVVGCEQNQNEDCKQRNRRTDIQFLW